MSVTRKPQRGSSAAVDVDALINRGGSPRGDQDTESKQTKGTSILLRIPADIMERLDLALKARPVKLPRHTWILEAIHEKLSRETQSKG
jgi:hypothetical protein